MRAALLNWMARHDLALWLFWAFVALILWQTGSLFWTVIELDYEVRRMAILRGQPPPPGLVQYAGNAIFWALEAYLLARGVGAFRRDLDHRAQAWWVLAGVLAGIKLS